MGDCLLQSTQMNQVFLKKKLFIIFKSMDFFFRLRCKHRHMDFSPNCTFFGFQNTVQYQQYVYSSTQNTSLAWDRGGMRTFLILFCNQLILTLLNIVGASYWSTRRKYSCLLIKALWCQKHHKKSFKQTEHLASTCYIELFLKH